MWILLIEKLPTKPSPPKLSIFLCLPWPDEGYVKKVKGRAKRGLLAPERLIMEDLIDIEQWEGARKIRYKDETIRVFPHEFNPVETKFIEDMVDGGAHTIVPESPAEEDVIDKTLRKGQREIYEAAIIDGATEA